MTDCESWPKWDPVAFTRVTVTERVGNTTRIDAAQDLNLVDEFFAPEIVCHMAGIREPIRGRAAFKQLLASLVAGFDDIHDTPEFLIAEGDMVVIRETAGGKHTRVFQGIPPTGTEVTVSNNEIDRIVEGQILEQWVGLDMLSLMQQLGVIPTPGHGSS